MMDSEKNGDKSMKKGMCCTCKCHNKRMTGYSVILFGLLFLLEAFGVLSADVVNVVWPLIIILFGSKLLCKCCNSVSGCTCS